VERRPQEVEGKRVVTRGNNTCTVQLGNPQPTICLNSSNFHWMRRLLIVMAENSKGYIPKTVTAPITGNFYRLCTFQKLESTPSIHIVYFFGCSDGFGYTYLKEDLT
jgi:hypothetical protein